MTNNKKRAEQLGMPYGTASARLKKLLMFKFAQELGYDNCFNCGQRIETSEELSVEHIEPWEGRENGVEKFWDLDNIAFSHRSCNRPHIYNPHHKKQAPDGQGWCSYGKHFAPIDDFYKNASKQNGIQNVCKKHNTESKRK